MAVAHIAFNFGLWRQCGNGVNDDHVKCARTDQHVGDFESLFTSVGLRDQQLIDVDSDGSCVHRIHRVFGVNVGTDAAIALSLGHNMHGEG